MSNELQIYRKRLIPEECILLKDDIIVEQNEDYILTKWKTLNPKTTFSHGCSCYYLKEGFKISKFYRHDGSLLDELAEALEKGLITQAQMSACLRQLNNLITIIYRDKFDRLQNPLDRSGL